MSHDSNACADQLVHDALQSSVPFEELGAYPCLTLAFLACDRPMWSVVHPRAL